MDALQPDEIIIEFSHADGKQIGIRMSIRQAVKLIHNLQTEVDRRQALTRQQQPDLFESARH